MMHPLRPARDRSTVGRPGNDPDSANGASATALELLLPAIHHLARGTDLTYRPPAGVTIVGNGVIAAREGIMSTHRSRKRSPKVPRAGVATLTEEYVPALTFPIADVRGLIEAASLAPLTSCDLSEVARALQRAVMEFIGLSPLKSNIGKRRDWAKRFLELMEEAMAFMDVDPESGKMRQNDAGFLLLDMSKD